MALVRRHHRAFYALLLAAPLEWLLRGRPVAGWVALVGSLLFLAGVVGYRRAGSALGPQLTPLVAPSEPPVLVERGPYRRLRHPMYLAELAMALGAPLTLGATVTLALTLVFAVIVVQRVRLEERVLGDTMPRYRDYAARTHRLVPYVY